jgi:hypothetical protein
MALPSACHHHRRSRGIPPARGGEIPPQGHRQPSSLASPVADNLWIADASVHATNESVNPVLTLFANAFGSLNTSFHPDVGAA